MTIQEQFIKLSKNMVVLYYNAYEKKDEEDKLMSDDVGILYFYEYDDERMEIAMLVKDIQSKIYKVLYDPADEEKSIKSFIFLM